MTVDLTYTDAFESNVKTAILVGSYDGTASATVSLQKAEKAFREAISVEYHTHIDERRELYKKALSVGDTDTVRVAEENLEEKKSAFTNVFAAGHSRFNKAKEAFESGAISIDIVDFCPNTHDDGEHSATEYGVKKGDTIPVAKSSSGNTYPLVEGESGHSDCLCPDKTMNQDFPVCKHEMVWLLTQVVLFERGCISLVDGSVTTLLNVITSEEASIDSEANEAVFEVIEGDKEPLICPN